MKTSQLVPVGAFVTMLTFLSAPMTAQSLAALAKQEESRRTGVSTPAKTYTNADLRADPTRSPQTTSVPVLEPQALAPPPSATAGPESTAEKASPGSATEPNKTIERNDTYNEGYWRGAAASIHQRLAAAREDQAALKSAGNTDNAKENARVAAALSRASADVAALETELRGFEARAAQMKVPRAWIQ